MPSDPLLGLPTTDRVTAYLQCLAISRQLQQQPGHTIRILDWQERASRIWQMMSEEERARVRQQMEDPAL